MADSSHPSTSVGLFADTLTIPGGAFGDLHVTGFDPLGWIQAQGIGAAKPVDTRTVQQRAADSAAGLQYDPATDTYTKVANAAVSDPSTSNDPNAPNPLTHPLARLQYDLSNAAKSVVWFGGLLLLGIVLTVMGAYVVVRE